MGDSGYQYMQDNCNTLDSIRSLELESHGGGIGRIKLVVKLKSKENFKYIDLESITCDYET